MEGGGADRTGGEWLTAQRGWRAESPAKQNDSLHPNSAPATRSVI